MHITDGGVEFVTASALVEAPFELKLFEVTPSEITMSTISLVSALDFDADYDDRKSFVQGRPVDRSFSRETDSLALRTEEEKTHRTKPSTATD